MERNFLTRYLKQHSLTSRSLVTGLAFLMCTAPCNALSQKIVAPAAPLKLVSGAFLKQNGSPSPQGKPNIANEVEATPDNKNGNNNNGPKPAQQPRTPIRRQPRNVPAPLDVTFTTDVPQSDIYINQPGQRSQKLGTTDTEGKLTVKLARGSHSITASHIGKRIVRQQIEVKQGNTAFNFALTLPVETNDSDAAKKDDASAANDEANAKDQDKEKKTDPFSDAHNAAEDVIKRYLDSTETDSITSSDWQLVQTQTSAELEKEPNNPRLKAQALFAQGQLAYLRGDYPNALVAFNKARLTDPNMVVAQYGLGNAYLATNQPQEALKAFQRAADLNPQLALAFKGSGDALTKQGKSKEALSFYDKAKNLGSTSVATSPNSVANLMKRKRWSEALKELLEISKTDQNVNVFVNMGDCYFELKQPLSAAQAYRKATEVDPQSALAAFRYGAMMFQLREYATAMEALERALALDQSGITINRNKARDMANKASEKLRKNK